MAIGGNWHSVIFSDLADKFVRVRLTHIDRVDLNLFEFDYDLTFMVYFLDASDKVYTMSPPPPAVQTGPAAMAFAILSEMCKINRRADGV